MYSTHQGRWEQTGDTQISKEALQHWGALVGGGALAVIGSYPSLTGRLGAGSRRRSAGLHRPA